MKKTHIFLDEMNRPYMTMPWGKDSKLWLFYWHKESHWTSLREVRQDEIFPNNLSAEHQALYQKAHKKWEDRT